MSVRRPRLVRKYEFEDDDGTEKLIATTLTRSVSYGGIRCPSSKVAALTNP